MPRVLPLDDAERVLCSSWVGRSLFRHPTQQNLLLPAHRRTTAFSRLSAKNQKESSSDSLPTFRAHIGNCGSILALVECRELSSASKGILKGNTSHPYDEELQLVQRQRNFLPQEPQEKDVDYIRVIMSSVRRTFGVCSRVQPS